MQVGSLRSLQQREDALGEKDEQLRAKEEDVVRVCVLRVQVVVDNDEDDAGGGIYRHKQSKTRSG